MCLESARFFKLDTDLEIQQKRKFWSDAFFWIDIKINMKVFQQYTDYNRYKLLSILSFCFNTAVLNWDILNVSNVVVWKRFVYHMNVE